MQRNDIMKHLARAALYACAIPALATAAGTASAQSRTYTLGALKIEQPWTRGTPKGAPVAGGYVTITNTGKSADRLTGGSFALARKFEIHEMSMENGIMKMRHMPKGIEIKPGATVQLKPGGYHLMFMGLKDQVKPGSSVKGTLVFEKAGKIELEFKASAIGSKTPPK